MNEVELKFFDINKEGIVSKLLGLGAEKKFEGKLRDSRFIKKNGSKKYTLRLRAKGDKVLITNKEAIESSVAKVRKETEVEVSNFEDARLLILSIDFKEKSISEKNRVEYLLNNVLYTFDKYIGIHRKIPEYLEIEARSIEYLKQAIELIELDIDTGKKISAPKLLKRNLRGEGSWDD